MKTTVNSKRDIRSKLLYRIAKLLGYNSMIVAKKISVRGVRFYLTAGIYYTEKGIFLEGGTLSPAFHGINFLGGFETDQFTIQSDINK